MIKKVVLLFILIFSIFAFDSSFAERYCSDETGECYEQSELKDINQIEAEQAAKANAEARNKECGVSGNCLDKTNFTIETTSMFDFGGGLTSKVNGSDSKAKIQSVLSIIIQKMMIVLGIISLFIMTVGAGYMITYHGEDELLSKGKTIFKAGIIALVVALSSYYLVSLIRYIIYN